MSEGAWELFTASLIYSYRRVICVPLTNRVRGPYCKLRTEFSSRRFTAEARRARTIKKNDKKQKTEKKKKTGSVTYIPEPENEVWYLEVNQGRGKEN